MLATTRSFRAARLAECCRHESAEFSVNGRIESRARSDLQVGWSAGAGQRKLNGKSSRLAEHLAVLPVVSWTAAEGEVIGGGPGPRRRFLDRGLVGRRPAALAVLGRYRRALEQKRQLLLCGGSGLGSWNRVLAEAADELIRERRRYAEDLAVALAKILAETGLELPCVALRYRPSPEEGGRGTEETLRGIEVQRATELERRIPLVGPHRDELELEWGDRAARRVASAGERKLLGLALAAARGSVLTAAERHPVYLLDDVDTELDSRRLETVWGLFRGRGQLFASSNRVGIWRRLEVNSRWHLKAGRAIRAES